MRNLLTAMFVVAAGGLGACGGGGTAVGPEGAVIDAHADADATEDSAPGADVDVTGDSAPAPDADALEDSGPAVAADTADATAFDPAPGFRVVGTTLVDADGHVFVVRGVNNPHIWWDASAYEALDDIALAGANTVRVVWQISGAVTRLDEILARIVALRMVPIIELHDVTGSPDPAELDRAVGWWVSSDVVALLSRYRREALVNIANEWGDHTVSAETWRATYAAAIARLRAAGVPHTLVIDGNAWGQGLDPILTHGAALLAGDPEHNLLFDLHMYGLWNGEGRPAEALDAAADAGLPLLIGEFGYDYAEGQNNLLCRVDAPGLLAAAADRAVGWLAWSWDGNNQENAWLDLSTDWSVEHLTPWGELVVNGVHGLRATARPASIFPASP